MTYKVKEIFYTLQGEGAHAGRPAVFCRFSSCNLWTGREADRERAICKFCDTDFVGTDGEGGGKFADADALADAVAARWPAGCRRASRWSSALGESHCSSWTTKQSAALKARGFYVAVETNGTVRPPAGNRLALRQPKGRRRAGGRARPGVEVRVSPRGTSTQTVFEDLDFESFRVQPMDGPDVAANTELAVKFCLEHPRWQLSLQTHKFLGIP